MRGCFLTALNHEVRTPLTAILGFTDNLAARGRIGREDLELVMEIGNFARQLASTLQEMQDLYVLEGPSGRLRWTNMSLGQVAAACVDDARALTVGTEISIHFSGDSESPVVALDEARFRRALGHLLEIVVRIVPSSGSIRVATGSSDEHAWVTVEPPDDATALDGGTG